MKVLLTMTWWDDSDPPRLQSDERLFEGDKQTVADNVIDFQMAHGPEMRYRLKIIIGET